MSFVKLRNIDPRGDLELPLVDGEVRRVVPAGEVHTVSAEEAGTAPGWRKATDEEAAEFEAFLGRYAIDAAEVTSLDDLDDEHRRILGQLTGREYRFHGGDLEVWDLGSGLLAQTDVWEKAGRGSAPPPDPAPVQILDGEAVTTDSTAKGGE